MKNEPPEIIVLSNTMKEGTEEEVGNNGLVLQLPISENSTSINGFLHEAKDEDGKTGKHNGIVNSSQVQTIKKEIIKVTLPPKWKSHKEILLHALKGALRSFLLAASIRGGITLFLSLFRVARGKESLTKALKDAILGSSTRRFSNMMGLFTFLWKGISNELLYMRPWLARMRRKISSFVGIEGGDKSGQLIEVEDEADMDVYRYSKRSGAISGAIAGLAILCESKENRIGYAQQFFFRSMQAGKNALKQRRFWTVPHGDALLFCLATASILHAYCFRPDTIPKGYYNWCLSRARVPKPVLLQHAEHANAVEKLGEAAFTIDKAKYITLMERVKSTPLNVTRFFDYLKVNGGLMPSFPCTLFHPTSESCVGHSMSLWKKVFIEMLPVYFSLTSIPMLVLSPGKIISQPLFQLTRIGKAVTQSSIFLATLISSFQGGMCLHHFFLPNHNTKHLIYPLAFCSALSIFLEKKSKRVDLAMFSLPKGMQSLYMILIDNGHMLDIPGIEVAASSVAMSVLMSLYQTEPHNIGGVLYKVMRLTLGDY